MLKGKTNYKEAFILIKILHIAQNIKKYLGTYYTWLLSMSKKDKLLFGLVYGV